MSRNPINIRVSFDENVMIDILAYERISQYYDDKEGCWVQRDPEYMTVHHGDVCGIFETTKQDLVENISTNVKYPTEICVMEIYDKDVPGPRHIRRVLIAGRYKDWKKRWEEFNSKYWEINEKYTKQRWALADEFKKELNTLLEGIH